MKDDLTVLKQARALIEKPENFCQGTYVEGHRHCALGAVFLAATSMEPWPHELPPMSSKGLAELPGMQALADTMHSALHPASLLRFLSPAGVAQPIVAVVAAANDTFGHDFILAAFDTAIAKLERDVAQANTVQEIMQTALEGSVTEPETVQ